MYVVPFMLSMYLKTRVYIWRPRQKTMAIIELTCPLCDSVVGMNLINLKTMESDTKTITCSECSKLFKFEYRVMPFEDRKNYKNKVWLHEQYVVKNRTMKEIADACGKSPMTIQGWLRKHDITSRSRGRRD